MRPICRACVFVMPKSQPANGKITGNKFSARHSDNYCFLKLQENPVILWRSDEDSRRTPIRTIRQSRREAVSVFCFIFHPYVIRTVFVCPSGNHKTLSQI